MEGFVVVGYRQWSLYLCTLWTIYGHLATAFEGISLKYFFTFKCALNEVIKYTCLRIRELGPEQFATLTTETDLEWQQVTTS